MQHQHYQHQDLTLHHHFNRIVRLPVHQHQHLKVQHQIQVNFDAICVLFQPHDSMLLFYTIKRMLQTLLQKFQVLKRHAHQVKY